MAVVSPVIWTVLPKTVDIPTVLVKTLAPDPPVKVLSKSSVSAPAYPDPPAVTSTWVAWLPDTTTVAVAPSHVVPPVLNNLTLL